MTIRRLMLCALSMASALAPSARLGRRSGRHAQRRTRRFAATEEPAAEAEAPKLTLEEETAAEKQRLMTEYGLNADQAEKVRPQRPLTRTCWGTP